MIITGSYYISSTDRKSISDYGEMISPASVGGILGHFSVLGDPDMFRQLCTGFFQRDADSSVFSGDRSMSLRHPLAVR